ncbi:hypothetical protein BX666DRAFT_2032871 [Dichotomocladium elegans]|nr:hypothetical protein BX666DRAFT_2032871 [Dichotomocladium elegans]
MTLREQFHGAPTSWFCEAKTDAKIAEMTSCFCDLFRLGLFAKVAIDKEEIKAILVLQAAGLKIPFCMTEFVGEYDEIEANSGCVPQMEEPSLTNSQYDDIINSTSIYESAPQIQI